MSQVCRQRFLDRFVIQERENGMDDLSHALRIKIAEFAIDGHSASHMNCSERWIGLVFLRLLGIFCWCKYLELVGSAVQSQLERAATSFPFPATERNKADSARKRRGVILDDVVSAA